VESRGGGVTCIFSSTPSGWAEDETKTQEIETSDFQFGARKGSEEGRNTSSGPRTQQGQSDVWPVYSMPSVRHKREPAECY
jgi:hypothetical protein